MNWLIFNEVNWKRKTYHSPSSTSPRWSRPPGAGFRLHLRDGVPHQGRERVPEPAARRPQRAAHAEKHAAGDKVSLMDRLIGPPALAVFMWCHRTCTACHARGRTGGNELTLCIAAYKRPRTSQFMVYEDIFPTHLLKLVCNLLVQRLAPLLYCHRNVNIKVFTDSFVLMSAP